MFKRGLEVKMLSAIIAAFITGVAGIITGVIATIKAHKSQVEVTHLKEQLRKAKEVEKRKERFSTPLLKVSEELYNKINDVVRNRNKKYPLKLFQDLPFKLKKLNRFNKIPGSVSYVYRTRFIHLFAQFFGAAKLIEEDLGFLKLQSDEETSEFHECFKKSLAVFYSGKLRDEFRIRKDKNMKYHGRIIDGSQILIGESMLTISDNPPKVISFWEFCQRYVSDKQFKANISPIIAFLEDLEVVELESTDDDLDDIDFRWTTLILFADYLRKLIEQIDSSKVVRLFKDTQKYATYLFEKSNKLKKNIEKFDKHYKEKV